jgi:archaellum component FlaC
MEKETTNDEILGAINEFSTKVDERFNSVDERFNSVDKRFDKIESVIVTKDYLDEKLADLRGDLVVLIRKEDTKVKKLVDILLKRNIISAT